MQNCTRALNNHVMKLFIKKILYQAIILLLISIIVDYFLSSTLKHSDSFAYGESLIWNEIIEGQMSKDILIYGSSRAWVHFDSKIIEDSLGLSTYNLGIDGHNFWLQYLRHKKLLKHNKPPNFIILSLGVFSLSKRKDLYNHYQFLPFQYDKEFYDYTKSYEGFSIFDYTLPMYRYIGKQDSIKKIIKAQFNEAYREPYRIKGFRGMHRQWNDDLAKAKLTIKSYESVMDQASVDLIQTFINECNRLNIRVILVYSPEYIEGQEFVSNRHEIISFYQNLALKNNLSFIDYSNDPICRSKNYFYNSMHLNADGARVFTNKLVIDLKKMDINN